MLPHRRCFSALTVRASEHDPIAPQLVHDLQDVRLKRSVHARLEFWVDPTKQAGNSVIVTGLLA
jgi:hypothetical protein